MNNPTDEFAIRALVANYADAVNRYDATAWGDTWAEDGQWLLRGDKAVTGKGAIVEFWQSVMETLTFAIMIPGSAQIHIIGNKATGRWTMVEIVEEKPGQGWNKGDGAHIVGVYNDHYSKVNNQWLIQSRHYHMLYQSPTSPDGQHAILPPEQLVPLS